VAQVVSTCLPNVRPSSDFSAAKIKNYNELTTKAHKPRNVWFVVHMRTGPGLGGETVHGDFTTLLPSGVCWF
jgi:hypothetical protein